MKEKNPFDYIAEIIKEDYALFQIEYIIDKLGEYYTYKQMKYCLKDFKLESIENGY